MINRRRFLTCSAGVVGAASLQHPALAASSEVARKPGVKLKLGLNAYSFNGPLQSGSMTLADAVIFCAENGVDALDATGYYFPGYPKTPPDDYVYALKRTAFLNGVAISGTGVRNNFAVADEGARKRDVQMVKNWIVVASKLGAPVIRVFSGPERPPGHTFDEALDWMVSDFKQCAAFGKDHGVVVGIQQHNDFLKTAAETIRVIQAVDSEWFGCILDIGSLRSGDPYAVSWQIKEEVGRNGKPEPANLSRIKALIDAHGYRGYVPFEALGPGDPHPRITAFLAKIRAAFSL